MVLTIIVPRTNVRALVSRAKGIYGKYMIDRFQNLHKKRVAYVGDRVYSVASNRLNIIIHIRIVHRCMIIICRRQW